MNGSRTTETNTSELLDKGGKSRLGYKIGITTKNHRIIVALSLRTFPSCKQWPFMFLFQRQNKVHAVFFFSSVYAQQNPLWIDIFHERQLLNKSSCITLEHHFSNAKSTLARTQNTQIVLHIGF